MQSGRIVAFPGSDDSGLLKQVSAGSESAFRVIFDRYRSKVYRYALRLCTDEAVAEDIVLELFLKIWQHPDPETISNLDVYLRVAARNAAYNELRKRQLNIRINALRALTWQEEHNETEESIDLKDVKNLIIAAIELLPPQQKLVYRLCKEEGLKYNQVAEQLSLSPLTVKTHMQHALRFLKRHIAKHGNVALSVMLFTLISKK